MAADITGITASNRRPVPELSDRELLEEIATKVRELEAEFRPLLERYRGGLLGSYRRARHGQT